MSNIFLTTICYTPKKRVNSPMKLITISILFSFHILYALSNSQHLIPKFQDANHDLLADAPKDASDYIDPYTLVFAYPPNESPMIYKEIWKDFIAYLKEVTGKDVVFFPYQSNAAEVEAMHTGLLHIAGFSTGTVPLAVNYAGFHPIVVMGDKNNSYGYKMEFITYPQSSIKSIKDLKHHTLTLTAPSSNSGYKNALNVLKNDFHLKERKDFQIRCSGNHHNSIIGVAKHQYEVAAIASSVKERMLQRGIIKKKDIKCLYQSETFPTTGYGYVYNLKPTLVGKIKKAFKTFQWTKGKKQSSLKKGFPKHDKFIEIEYKEAWHFMLNDKNKY